MKKHVETKLNTEDKMRFLLAATEKFGDREIVAAPRITELAERLGEPKPMWLFVKANRVSRGMYRLPAAAAGISAKHPRTQPVPSPSQPVAAPEMLAATTNVVPISSSKKFDPNVVSTHSYAAVPERDEHYVPFGEFKDVEKIISSRKFFPVFISGVSGSGKTFMVEQAAARARRAMIRIQISRETDEDDLIGGFRLIDGETKFLKGPVLRAMELGALLLLDEADRADPGKLMCIQGILEGKNFYVKKTGEIVTPAPGFNIIVTANTKGKGSYDGRYAAATILDDAWLERFVITIEQEYPTNATEQKIVRSYLCDDREGNEEELDFVKYLTNWAEIIRKTFNEGAIDETISTRRLVHIVQTYKMFGDRMQAIRMCVNRFDEETKIGFLDLYAKVDPTLAPPTPVVVDTNVLATADVPTDTSSIPV